MNLEKRNKYSNDIIILDGLWGTGKGILGPIISGMNGVENIKLECIYEHICVMHHMGKISSDAALWVLQSYVDYAQYNNLIGREVNLRWSDDTGMAYSPDKMKYIMRLFVRDGDTRSDLIDRHNLAFSLMTHLIMLTPEILHVAFSQRLSLIEVVRHPLLMVKHIASYFSRFESQRELTPSYYLDEIKVPWFASEWAAQYLISNSTERAALFVYYTYGILFNKIDWAVSAGMKVHIISFEGLTNNTMIEMQRLSEFLDREHHPDLKKILNKQRIPRVRLSDGLGHASYGWKKSKLSDRDYVHLLRSELAANCNEDVIDKFQKVSSLYEMKFPNDYFSL